MCFIEPESGDGEAQTGGWLKDVEIVVFSCLLSFGGGCVLLWFAVVIVFVVVVVCMGGTMIWHLDASTGEDGY